MPNLAGSFVFSGSALDGASVFESGVPAFGAITTAATSITFAYTGSATHYRAYQTGGAAGAWVAISPSPVTVSGLTVNQPYTIELSGDGATVAATVNTGTDNPGSGSGEPVASVPIALQVAEESDAAVTLLLAQALQIAQETSTAFNLLMAQVLGVAAESDQAVQLLQPGALGLAQETDEAVPLVLITPEVITAAEETDQALSLVLASPMALSVAVESDEAIRLLAEAAAGTADPAAVWSYVLSDGRTAGETLVDNARMLRILLAALSGQTQGIGTATETYFGEDGVTPRLVATFDGQGNRVSVLTDGAP